MSDSCPVVSAIAKLGGMFETLEDNLFVGGKDADIRYSDASYKASKLNIRLASMKLAGRPFSECVKITKYGGINSNKLIIKLTKNKILRQKFYKLAKMIAKFEYALCMYVEMHHVDKLTIPTFVKHKHVRETLASAVEYVNKLMIAGKKPTQVSMVAEFNVKEPEITLIIPMDMEQLDEYVEQMTTIYKHIEKVEAYQVQCIHCTEKIIDALSEFAREIDIMVGPDKN